MTMRQFDIALCTELEHGVLRAAAGQPLPEKRREFLKVRDIGFPCLAC